MELPSWLAAVSSLQLFHLRFLVADASSVPAHQKMTVSIAVESCFPFKCMIPLFPTLPSILKVFLPQKSESLGSYL